MVSDELRREEGEVRAERGERDTGVVVSFQSRALARVAYSTFCASTILFENSHFNNELTGKCRDMNHAKRSDRN